jgi:hypothetical protein
VTCAGIFAGGWNLSVRNKNQTCSGINVPIYLLPQIMRISQDIWFPALKKTLFTPNPALEFTKS